MWGRAPSPVPPSAARRATTTTPTRLGLLPHRIADPEKLRLRMGTCGTNSHETRKFSLSRSIQITKWDFHTEGRLFRAAKRRKSAAHGASRGKNREKYRRKPRRGERSRTKPVIVEGSPPQTPKTTALGPEKSPKWTLASPRSLIVLGIHYQTSPHPLAFALGPQVRLIPQREVNDPSLPR